MIGLIFLKNEGQHFLATASESRIRNSTEVFPQGECQLILVNKSSTKKHMSSQAA